MYLSAIPRNNVALSLLTGILANNQHGTMRADEIPGKVTFAFDYADEFLRRATPEPEPTPLKVITEATAPSPAPVVVADGEKSLTEGAETQAQQQQKPADPLALPPLLSPPK